MTDSNQIKYVVVGRPLDGVILASQSLQSLKKAVEKEYTEEAQKEVAKIGQMSPYPDLREQNETIFGTWFTYCDHNLLSYSVLCGDSYSQATAQDFLRKLSRQCYESNPDLNEAYSTI